MGKDQVVLFVCQHGAAKSVLAAELLSRRVAGLHLPVTVRSAGVEPDAVVSDRLLDLFPDRARELAARRPRRVKGEDVQDASIVVTFNVVADSLPASPGHQLSWDDVPPVSEDPAGARAAIERHIDALVEVLDP